MASQERGYAFFTSEDSITHVIVYLTVLPCIYRV